MAFTSNGLNYLLQAYYENRSGLELRAYNASSTLLDSTTVTYSVPASADTDLEASATLTIASGETVTSVKLYKTDGAVQELASETISASFPNGGDLIVTSFELSVS
jgi:hypothetical protein